MRVQTHLPDERGVSLIELMIAMVLGLIVIGGVISLFVSNSQTYRATEALSHVQESARTAFELLARDIRQAAGTACGASDRIANTLEDKGLWWQDWVGIMGYDAPTAAAAVDFGSAIGQRINGTDALLLQGMNNTGLYIASHNVTSANFKINAATTTLSTNDILMICDFTQASIFQATSYNSQNVTVVHNTGTGTIGNCSKGLGFPTICTTLGNPYQYSQNSQIARLSAVTWYIGNNGRAADGGRGLYRQRLGSGASVTTEEIVSGVTDMQLSYRQGTSTDFITADAVGNWDQVNAVQVTLTIDSTAQNIATTANNEGRLQRTLTTVVALRNRNE